MKRKRRFRAFRRIAARVALGLPGEVAGAVTASIFQWSRCAFVGITLRIAGVGGALRRGALVAWLDTAGDIAAAVALGLNGPVATIAGASVGRRPGRAHEGCQDVASRFTFAYFLRARGRAVEAWLITLRGVAAGRAHLGVVPRGRVSGTAPFGHPNGALKRGLRATGSIGALSLRAGWAAYRDSNGEKQSDHNGSTNHHSHSNLTWGYCKFNGSEKK